MRESRRPTDTPRTCTPSRDAGSQGCFACNIACLGSTTTEPQANRLRQPRPLSHGEKNTGPEHTHTTKLKREGCPRIGFELLHFRLPLTHSQAPGSWRDSTHSAQRVCQHSDRQQPASCPAACSSPCCAHSTAGTHAPSNELAALHPQDCTAAATAASWRRVYRHRAHSSNGAQPCVCGPPTPVLMRRANHRV